MSEMNPCSSSRLVSWQQLEEQVFWADYQVHLCVCLWDPLRSLLYVQWRLLNRLVCNWHLQDIPWRQTCYHNMLNTFFLGFFFPFLHTYMSIFLFCGASAWMVLEWTEKHIQPETDQCQVLHGAPQETPSASGHQTVNFTNCEFCILSCLWSHNFVNIAINILVIADAHTVTVRSCFLLQWLSIIHTHHESSCWHFLLVCGFLTCISSHTVCWHPCCHFTPEKTAGGGVCVPS